jgi:putative endonuclease
VNAGERRAARHYRLRGWRLVGANVRVGRNELDLIVRRGSRLLFVEVKEKRGAGYGDPLEMVDAEKLRRVRAAAKGWLAANPIPAGLEIGFEIVGVAGRRLERVRVQPGDEGLNAA